MSGKTTGPEHAKPCASILKKDAEAQNLKSCLFHPDIVRTASFALARTASFALKAETLAKPEQTFRKPEPDIAMN